MANGFTHFIYHILAHTQYELSGITMDQHKNMGEEIPT